MKNGVNHVPNFGYGQDLTTFEFSDSQIFTPRVNY
jgi:hypothetical protein